MKNFLFILAFLLMFVSFVYAQEQIGDIVGVEINYNEGNFLIKDMYRDFGYKSENVENFDYILKSLDRTNGVLDELYFSMPEVASSPDPNWFDEETGEQIIIPELKIEVTEIFYLPFKEEIKYILILDKSSKELLKIDVAEFSLNCGDYDCQSYESFESCPHDCVEESVDFDGEQKFWKWRNNLFYILMGILVFVGGVIVFFVIKRKRANQISNPKLS